MTGSRGAVYAAPVITLFQPPPLFGIPSLTPFGTKVETYLRMVDLPYTVRDGDPRRGPTGKIPYIEVDGRRIGDSSEILEQLARLYPHTLDDGLTAAQRAVGHVTRRTLEEHLYWALAYTRWVEPDGFRYVAAYFRGLLPPVIGPLILGTLIRRDMRGALHRQGLGRHDRDGLYRRGCADVDAVATLLADGPFFFGEQPTTIDCSVFAFTSAALMFPADNPLKRCMAGHPNLVAYNERMCQRYFGDHPPGSSRPR